MGGDNDDRMRPDWAQDCSSKRIDYVRLYKPKFASSSKKKKRGVRMYHVMFMVLYVNQLIWVVSTIGQPYRLFLEKADREGFSVMEGSAKMRAQMEYALGDINDPNRRTDKIGWFDWMDMDIEEHANAKKREKEKSVLDSLPKSMRVPGKHAPAFTPMLLTGILITLHCLVVLMQHWSVSFDVKLNYTEVNPHSIDLSDDDDDDDNDDDEVKDGLEIVKQASEKGVPAPHLPTHARVTPSDAADKDVLVPLLYLPTLGMTFEYHRRRYIYDGTSDVWCKTRCTTDMPTEFFGTWKGLSSEDMVMASQIRFGPNVFDVKKPTFMELYKKQLLSPFTVFQLFCVVLWMLDDYWQYSFFTLFMILMFEATVVFSRIKSLNALQGMGNNNGNSNPLLVYRNQSWTIMDACDLLPGDILSLTRKHTKNTATATSTTTEPTDNNENIVPADILLLRGTTVVNEASLTGESVPQMKEGLSELLPHDSLDMKNKHKTHVLYAGTKLLQCQGTVNDDTQEEEEGHTKGLYGDIPKPKDGGCLCFVLRTGFSSAQGKLVRMMEGSQEKVKGHERETGLLLLMLFFFALASSSYVLYHGWHNENRSQYELLLHCILIITSVIPPELPMQMAMAVNNSLMTLMKMQVFCTEPFRVPIAGKLDACLFDKTGTLTTDELVAVGVCTAKSCTSSQIQDATKQLTPMTKISNEAALVLAGCHSLIWIDGEMTGDPLESASLNAMRWGFHPNKTTRLVAKEATEKKEEGKPIVVNGQRIQELEVLARHHFASKLQRMSCVVRDVTNRRTFAVVKGSPEAIGNLIIHTPKQYDVVAKALAKRGYRVIALAYKPLESTSSIDNAKDARAHCESNVGFAGFIAFTCRVRKDTKMVLNRLKEGGMTVTMVTGDALLTAAHVAQQVAICDSPTTNSNSGAEEEEEDDDIAMETNEDFKKLWKMKRKLNPKVKPKFTPKNNLKKSILILEQRNGNNLYWQSYDDETYVADYVAAEVPEVAKKYDLATTGKNLAAALEYDNVTRTILAHFKIFARMTPDAKETVIECLHSVGSLCLMCGDGANDVGALKRADVGVALLSGFGDINVDKGEDGNNKKKKDDDDIVIDPKTLPKGLIMNEREKNVLKTFPVFAIHTQLHKIGVDPKKYPEFVSKDDLVQLYEYKSKEYVVKKLKQKKLMEEKKQKITGAKSQQKDLMAEKQLKMQKRAQELAEAGESFATLKAMKEFWGNEVAENKQKKAQIAKNNSVEGSAATLAAQLDDLEMEEIPMVKLGDASIAAPFTSKMPSIRSCVDIIRQGRCTLVTSIQMYQILALNCLISAYSLSVLYLDGVKYGDVQMTSMGMLMSVSFMSVSRSKPLDKLSPVKPLTSIFHPSLFISLLGQFTIHLGTMYIAVRAAKAHLPLDYEADLDGEFKPGILNSVVFLVSNVQQVTVFVVNLQGAPFMTGLTENRPLLWSLVATFILTFMFASESVPSLNKYFQLVSFPDDAFRDWILMILVFDVVSTFLLDRIMKLIFCPSILFASVAGTTSKDVIGLGKTIGTILGVMYIFLGNNETWDELMEEEARLAGALGNESSITDSILNAAEACIGASCGVETDEL